MTDQRKQIEELRRVLAAQVRVQHAERDVIAAARALVKELDRLSAQGKSVAPAHKRTLREALNALDALHPATGPHSPAAAAVGRPTSA